MLFLHMALREIQAGQPVVALLTGSASLDSEIRVRRHQDAIRAGLRSGSLRDLTKVFRPSRAPVGTSCFSQGCFETASRDDLSEYPHVMQIIVRSSLSRCSPRPVSLRSISADEKRFPTNGSNVGPDRRTGHLRLLGVGV